MIIPDTICQHMLILKQRANCIDLKRHSYLYLENDASDTVYMIEKGMIMLTKLLPDGRELGIILLTGKNLFGHCEVLSNTPREHQAMALTQCRLWAVSAQTFLNETKQSSEFTLALARLQNERLRHVEKHISTISQGNVTKRLTATLLEIVHSAECGGETGSSIKPCPTHQDLATMISSTRETVSAIMGKLRKLDIIAFDRRELKILNQDLIREYGLGQ